MGITDWAKNGKIVQKLMYVRVVVRLPQRLKNLHSALQSAGPLEPLPSIKFPKKLILTFEADCAASQNCTFFGTLHGS